MGRLKHRLSPARTYFVTTKTWGNRDLFRVADVADIVVQCILRYRSQGAYLLHEFVVMPNHLHLLLTPAENTTLEKALQLIKGGSSHEIHGQRGHKMEIWQAGFHDWTVRDAADYEARASYIRLNPVAARLVERPEQWAYGSASGRFSLDAAPEFFKTSGAEAPGGPERGMSELKLRPPRRAPSGSVGAKGTPPWKTQ
jgi:REP-associated tyrosine transposase